MVFDHLFDPLSGLASIFGSPTILYAARSDLEAHLRKVKFLGDVGSTPTDSPLLLLRRSIERFAAVNSINLLVSSSGGETVGKVELFENAFDSSLNGRLMHLMCYAGRSSSGNPILFNVPKPVFGNKTESPYLMKVGAGGDDAHLVLNIAETKKRFDGFEPLPESELFEITGMRPHGVNLLLAHEKYNESRELRSVVCDSLFKLYLESGYTKAYLIEIPLGEEGQTYSIVVPLEFFLAFLLHLSKSYPQVEVQGHGRISEDEISQMTDALSNLLSSSSLVQELRYDPRRPVMATFNAFVGQLSRELVRRAPYIDSDTAKTAVTNFVRHFFAVEYEVVVKALQATEDAEISACFEALRQTEYGALIMPCESIESFRSKLASERAKLQPKVPFQFSSEDAKSELYLRWLARMGKELRNQVMATIDEGLKDPHLFLSHLAKRLTDDCTGNGLKAAQDSNSLENAVSDFLELFFGKLKLMLAKVEDKLSVLLKPDSAHDVITGTYWSHYWTDIRGMTGKAVISLDDPIMTSIFERAIAADVEILLNLPFAKELFGDGRLIAAMVTRHLGAIEK